MTPIKNTVWLWCGILLVAYPTLMIFVAGIYYYPSLLKGMFHTDFYQYPTYSYVPGQHVDTLFIVVNIVFWATLLLSWIFILRAKLSSKHPVLFILCSMIPLVMIIVNHIGEPRGRMLSRIGNEIISFIEKGDGYAIISTYANEKVSERYDLVERPKWILVRKDTIPENRK